MDYRGLFVDICAGFSEVPRNSFLIKHPTLSDLSKVEKYRERRLLDLIAKGAKTEAEILLLLKEQGLWSDTKEKELENLKGTCKGISDSIPKIKNSKQKKQVEQALNETKAKMKKLADEKEQYVGTTAESAAELSAWEFKKSILIVKPDGSQLFSWDEWEDLDDKDLEIYTRAYYNHLTLFTEYNIGNIAVQAFFRDIYGQYPSESTYLLWQRPAKDLTEYQILLGKLAQFARGYLEHNRNLPESIKTDIYKLIEHNNAGVKAIPTETSNSDIEAKRLTKVGDGGFNLVKDYKKMKTL